MADNNNNGATLDDVMGFLKENMVMNEDFQSFKKGVDEKFQGMNVKLESLDTRLAEMQSELQDIKVRLDAIEKRIKEDVDAVVLEVQKLKARVMVLEQQLSRQQASLRN